MALFGCVLVGWAEYIPFARDHVEKAEKFGEAFLVAALLAGTVDLFVKRRLVREVVADVSPYIMGHALPSEIRHEIREMSVIDLYRTGFELDYELLPIPGEADFILLKVSTKYRLHNISDEAKSYRHTLFVQKPHRPTGHIVQIPNAGAKGVMECKHGTLLEYNYEDDLGQDDQLDPFRRWEKIVWIPPLTTPETAPAFWGITFQVLPSETTDTFYTLTPTIGFTVRVNRPEGMTVTVSFGHRNDAETIKIPPHNPWTWELQTAFLPWQSVIVDWRVRPTPDVAALVDKTMHPKALNRGASGEGKEGQERNEIEQAGS